MWWSWKTLLNYESHQLLYFCLYCVCFNKTEATAAAWLVKACRVLAESQAAWKCQGNHTQHSEGFSAFLEPRVKLRLRDKWKIIKRKEKRERPVKYCTQSYTVIPAAQCHLRLPPLSVSSPWCLNPVESMGSALSGETQTKTDRYSNKSLVGWFL